jgi:anti-sigma factor ChrR (cupin superfamily)
MTRLFLALIGLGALACAVAALARTAAADEKQRSQSEARQAAAGVAGTGDAAAHHRVVVPDQIEWKDGPPSLPPGCKFAVLEGDPAKPGFFCMRAKLPNGYKVPPHFHPGVERITIISGTFHLGSGEKFDKSAATALPAGSYSSMQPGMKHFGWAEGETVVQTATEGPWGITYVNPSDDPRRKR